MKQRTESTAIIYIVAPEFWQPDNIQIWHIEAYGTVWRVLYRQQIFRQILQVQVTVKDI